MLFIIFLTVCLCVLQEYESWVQIARSRRKAGDDHEAVHKAFEQARSAAQQMDCNQKLVPYT